jgi:hypothetical protein
LVDFHSAEALLKFYKLKKIKNKKNKKNKKTLKLELGPAQEAYKA